MIGHVRYFLGVTTVIILPLGLLYWIVIHLWACMWRALGPIRTYLIVLPVLAALGALLFRFRGRLLGEDLGTNWILIGIALVLSCVMTWLEFQYWRQLNIATLVGIPELSQHRKGKLLRGGIYGVVRHPRYLSAGIGLVASTLIINHVGLYILVLLALPPGYMLLVLEERELVDRFGQAYREYQREVPCLIPRRPKTR